MERAREEENEKERGRERKRERKRKKEREEEKEKEKERGWRSEKVMTILNFNHQPNRTTLTIWEEYI